MPEDDKGKPYDGFTRLQKLRARGRPLGLPELGSLSYMVELLFRAGPLMSGAMGMVPLSWSEVHAFASVSMEFSSPWEVETLREMSLSFHKGLDDGKDIFSIPPVERKDI